LSLTDNLVKRNGLSNNFPHLVIMFQLQYSMPIGSVIAESSILLALVQLPGIPPFFDSLVADLASEPIGSYIFDYALATWNLYHHLVSSSMISLVSQMSCVVSF
jgi:hypothetical protein